MLPSQHDSFDEITFIYALISRPEEVKNFSMFFKTDYLSIPTLKPIYKHIVQFTKKHSIPPSTETLKALIIKEFDEKIFKAKYHSVLQDIDNKEGTEASYLIHVLDEAKQVAIVRSFQNITNSQNFLKFYQNNDGKSIMKSLEKWRMSFMDKYDFVTMNFLEAVDTLQNNRSFIDIDIQIPCGIGVVDKWMDGGLRTKNLGIWMAPSGHGKSACMVYTTNHMVMNEEKNVWFISNELDMDEVTERFLSRVTGVKINKIMRDPALAIVSSGMKFVKKNNLYKKLMISYINRDASTDELEAEMNRFMSLWGWKPDVIVVDHMERLKPNQPGISREKSWIYIGQIAKDLYRLAKAKNVAIWTAIQTNREGLNASELFSSMAQGSIQQLQEAAAVIGLHQPVEVEDGKQIMEFKPIKLRHTQFIRQTKKLVCDLSKMTITDIEYEREEVERPADPEPPPIKYRKKSSWGSSA